MSTIQQPENSHWLVSAEKQEHADMLAFARDLATVQRRRMAPGTVPMTEAGRPWFPRSTTAPSQPGYDGYTAYATPERRLAMQQWVCWYLSSPTYQWLRDYFEAQCVLQTVAHEEMGRSLNLDELTLFDATFGKVWRAQLQDVAVEVAS